MSTRRPRLMPGERAWLVAEVRGRRLALAAEQRKADLELFRDDPYFTGLQPQTRSAAGRRRWEERQR